jgi:alkylhydroperoxidase family enzyme
VARIDLPPGDELTAWLRLSPLGESLGAFAGAVYSESRLSLREFEAARMRVAVSSGCTTCLHTRHAEGAAQGLDAAFYANVARWREHAGYSERERLAIEFAERFCERWQEDAPAFWERLRAAFSDGEIVDLAIQVAELVGAGRILRMLDIAQTCGLTIHADRSMELHPLAEPAARKSA